MIHFHLSILFFLTFVSMSLFSQITTDNIILINNQNYRIVIYNDLSTEIIIRGYETKDQKFVHSNSLFKIFLNDDSVIDNFLITGIDNFIEQTPYGKSNVFNFKCNDTKESLLLEIKVMVPFSFKDVMIIDARIKNLLQKNLYISKIINCNLIIDYKNVGLKSPNDFWSFLPESTPERQNWIKPLNYNFFQKNYQGMNAMDYGGGIPLLDIWERNQGIAIASLETKPLPISFPIEVNDKEIRFSLENQENLILHSNQEYKLNTYVVILHKGDFFNALNIYSILLQINNFDYPQSHINALEPEWCTWGYERNINSELVLKTLDNVIDLGIQWVTIDDGWQSVIGDWTVSNEKFNNDEKSFIALIDSIHAKGLKVRLWWVPLAANDSSYSIQYYSDRMVEYGMNLQSDIALKHPEWFILNEKGERYLVSWWNAYQLCPALEEILNYYKIFVTKAITEWKVDGFKLDGQNINLAPPCFNPLHKHITPYESSVSTPLFFKAIYETAKNLNRDFLIQICPCGTNYSIFNLPFVDQVVASDPLNSKQIRIKGKTFKALFGNKIAYSGDHIELTNKIWDPVKNKFVVYREEDFISTIGIGGVLSTKFIDAKLDEIDSSLVLTDSKKNFYSYWFNLYNKIKLSEGEYLNLYDIAFDKPETHVIKKGEILYYTLFDNKFEGYFELKGLNPGLKYEVRDVLTNKFLDIVDEHNPKIYLNFEEYLLIEGSPIK